MDSSEKPTLLNSFLIVYFYKIENELNNTKNGLETIKFQSEESKNSEKWFNNAIRKFGLKFLEYSEELTKIEKESLKKTLTKLIK